MYYHVAENLKFSKFLISSLDYILSVPRANGSDYRGSVSWCALSVHVYVCLCVSVCVCVDIIIYSNYAY